MPPELYRIICFFNFINPKHYQIDRSYKMSLLLTSIQNHNLMNCERDRKFILYLTCTRHMYMVSVRFINIYARDFIKIRLLWKRDALFYYNIRS